MNYEDLGYNKYFEKKLEEIEARRGAAEKISVDSLPELSTSDLRSIIESIPIELIPQFSTNDVVRLIESIPPELIQKKVLASENGKLWLDLDQGRIILKDNTTNRIVFDGITGDFKISMSGYDVLSAASENLSLHFDSITGDLKMKGFPINTSAVTFSHLSDEHYWTDYDWWTDRAGCMFSFNGDDFKHQDVYFESVMGNEQSNRTAYTRIYNISDNMPLVGSTISTTTYNLENIKRIRTTSPISFPSGDKEYRIQIKMSPRGTTGDNAHYYNTRLVHFQK